MATDKYKILARLELSGDMPKNWSGLREANTLEEIATALGNRFTMSVDKFTNKGSVQYLLKGRALIGDAIEHELKRSLKLYEMEDAGPRIYQATRGTMDFFIDISHGMGKYTEVRLSTDPKVFGLEYAKSEFDEDVMEKKAQHLRELRDKKAKEQEKLSKTSGDKTGIKKTVERLAEQIKKLVGKK